MEQLQNGDYVEAHFNGSRYYGKLSNINRKYNDGTVTMAPGITMILPLSSMIKKEKGAGNGTHTI